MRKRTGTGNGTCWSGVRLLVGLLFLTAGIVRLLHPEEGVLEQADVYPYLPRGTHVLVMIHPVSVALHIGLVWMIALGASAP